MSTTPRPGLLILASTYPRWANDSEPGFVHELAKRLAADFEVSVITSHAAGAQRHEWMDGVQVQRYRYAPLPLQTLVYGGGIVTHLRRTPWKLLLVPGFVLMQWLAAWRLIRQRRPAVIHAHWLLPQGIIARLLAGQGVPYVVTSHGADLFALRGKGFDRLRRWVVGRAAAVTVVSRAMRQQVLAESPQATVQVAPMGVEARQRFIPAAEVVRSPAELLFVGRLVEKKGLIHLIEALPAIARRHPAVHLRIAGFGPEQARLQDRARQLGVTDRLSFLGAVPQAQLPELYRRASLFVAPFVQARSGDQEGLGLVVAEAMACECPVLVGDVPAVHDVLAEGTGSVVDASDHAALAAAVNRLLDDPAALATQARRARRHVLEHFDWQAVAHGYVQLLREAAGRQPSR